MVGCRLQALDGDRREAVQGIAELVERQRLDVELDVGAVVARIGAGENAELRRRHGQRSAARTAHIQRHRRGRTANDRSRSRCGRLRPCRSRAAADGPADCAPTPGRSSTRNAERRSQSRRPDAGAVAAPGSSRSRRRKDDVAAARASTLRRLGASARRRRGRPSNIEAIDQHRSPAADWPAAAPA